MSLQLARSTAEKLAAAHCNDRLPIHPDLIARKLGIAYVTEHLEDSIDGLLIVKNGRSTICINKDKIPNRQRFSAAHELGHHVLGHYARAGEHVHAHKGALILKRSAISSEGIDPMEVEANQFAASLLMPSNMVRMELENLDIIIFDEAAIELLAKRFQVSVQAMTIRLSSMNLI